MRTQQSLSRRAFLSGIALTAAGAILTACGGSSATKNPSAGVSSTATTGGATTGSTPTAAPNVASGNQSTSANIPTPRNQTVILEQSKVDIFDSFNPFIPNGEAYQYGVNQSCREHMFYANFEQGKIVPWLATKYEYSPDFTQLTLSLNPQAKWSDGQPYNADDVLFTLQLLKDHSNFVGSSVVTTFIDSVTAPNANTVVIKLKQPNPRFHYNFIAGIVNSTIRVVPKHIWEKQDANTYRNNPPIYTGPYVLDRVIPQQFAMRRWPTTADEKGVCSPTESTNTQSRFDLGAANPAAV
jgi:peptide/nickel transport system substrate-binding protein